MPISAKLNRKTRAQKIKSSERAESQQDVIVSSEMSAGARLAVTSQDDYSYISGDLKRIAWTTVVCLAILAIVTVLMSDFGTFASIRSSLNLPTL